MDNQQQRLLLATTIKGLVGCPYIWNGKGDLVGVKNESGITVLVPSGDLVFDCSGAVGWAIEALGQKTLQVGKFKVLKRVQGIRFQWNTDCYWNELPPIQIPFIGDVALYGGTALNDVSHIEMVTAVGGWGVEVTGASGGDSRTTTVQKAQAIGAKVSTKKTHMYRRDFRGFRSVSPLLG